MDIDVVKEINVGFTPECGATCPVLLQDERNVFLIFYLSCVNQKKFYEDTLGIIQFVGCTITKFGYPNDEALGGHPLYENGLNFYRVFEVVNSSWIISLTEQNRVCFPDTNDDTTSKHYIITFHDNTFECIADEMICWCDKRPKHEVIDEISGRLY